MQISFTTLGPLRVACAILPPAICLLLSSDALPPVEEDRRRAAAARERRRKTRSFYDMLEKGQISVVVEE